MFAAGCQHGAVHQCQPVRAVCAHPDRTSPEEGLPAGSQLHRRETPHGGRERETGTGVRVNPPPLLVVPLLPLLLPWACLFLLDIVPFRLAHSVLVPTLCRFGIMLTPVHVHLNLLYLLFLTLNKNAHSGAPANEPVAQERSYGDERGFPEAPRKDLSQNLHPAPWQCQVGSTPQLIFQSPGCERTWLIPLLTVRFCT